jgi:glycolate oxidase iron-sulfur subunit
MNMKSPKPTTQLEKDLLKCVRCGSCKIQCPTYRHDALEVTSARGRLVLLRGLLTGEMKPSPLLNERIFSCILCGACAGKCPLGIDIPETIYHGRALLSKTDKERKQLRTVTKFTTRWPDLSFKMLRMSQQLVLPLLYKKGLIPFIPEFPETVHRSRRQVYKTPKKRGRVAVFSGCSVEHFFPHLEEALIHVLNKLGYEVILPKGLACCGAPLRTLGMEEESVARARKNLGILNKLTVEAVLSPCPTCTLTLKNDYPKIVGRGVENAVDISVFLNDKLEPARTADKTAVYHDPCHLKYGLGIEREPREMIIKAGLELIGPQEQGCCGFGGVFCLSQPEMSNTLLTACTTHLRHSEADAVITSCPGCMLQLSRTITDRPVLHLIELIEEAYCFEPSDEVIQDKEKTKS